MCVTCNCSCGNVGIFNLKCCVIHYDYIVLCQLLICILILNEFCVKIQKHQKEQTSRKEKKRKKKKIIQHTIFSRDSDFYSK